MMISLSILEYESDFLEHKDAVEESGSFSQITRLIDSGKIHRVHIDVMRPPMIPGKTRFPVELIRRLHESLRRRTRLAIHLMVSDPLPIIQKINEFIAREDRAETTIFIQCESFSSEEETVKALRLLKDCGYAAGICLNLPTPRSILTEKIVESADTVLLMSVPMGEGGQKYSARATRRIAYFSQRFPRKIIEVDGGMNPQTIAAARKAGARIAVVGSFITQNTDPIKALEELERSLEHL